MLVPIYTRRFEKDVSRAQKRGKDLDKLKKVVHLLLQEKPLPAKYHNHKLKGDFINHWECHIEPDWLLIYKPTGDELILVATGTHSDLF
jgi:mRNA interferase YafQ